MIVDRWFTQVCRNIVRLILKKNDRRNQEQRLGGYLSQRFGQRKNGGQLMAKFDALVPYIRNRLIQHHDLYTSLCKAELWEELLSKALIDAGFGSDWKPDYNHQVGVDQVTDCGIRISNKGGIFLNNSNAMKISGSRLTSHKTLEDKLEFLSNKTEDYIFVLPLTREIKKYILPQFIILS